MDKAQFLFVGLVALAFLTDSTSINEGQPETFESLDVVNAQMTTSNLKLTSNFYHYLMWVVVSGSMLALTVHFSQRETSGPLNIIVMLILLIVLLYWARYLFTRFSFRIETGS